MVLLDWKKELTREGHRVVLSGHPITMHCHHYNINLQKTLEETLGDDGIQLIFDSAELASYHVLKTLFTRYTQIKTFKSKIELASILYQNSGFGVLHFQEIGPEGGKIYSPSSHHVTGWLAKHGRRDTPGCHFARGWIAGAIEAIYQLEPGHFAVSEKQCKMVRNEDCLYHVSPAAKAREKRRYAQEETV